MAKPLISPSLLSANFANLQADIQQINRSEADWLHIDVMPASFICCTTLCKCMHAS